MDQGLLQAMNRSLIHRGPDDEGWGKYVLHPDPARREAESTPPNLGLASRRLAILDLSPAGRLPLASEDGRVEVVFNGEIYNYRELKTELENLGHVFRTRTDTEVIVHAYEQWGPDCLKRFNGMWALALADLERGRLFCSRDRFGIKPFHYFFDGRAFVFASEIKALLLHPDAPRQPDGGAMFRYLARSYRFVDGRPTTFFENIKQLEAGHYLLIDARGLRQERYWKLDPHNETELSKEEDYVNRYRELLKDAVRLRLRSDVPVAAQLSGGLDSSAIAALAARELGPGLPVFSACYDEKPFDETEFIAPTVDRIRADWHRIFPEPENLLDTLRQMIALFDEPICTVTFYAHWQVMAAVRAAGYKVILNGHGADELAAGYYDHFLHRLVDLKGQGDLRFEAERKAWLDLHGSHREEGLIRYLGVRRQGLDYMTDYLRLFKPYEAALGPALTDEIEYSAPIVQDPFPGVLAGRLQVELLRETVPAVLKAEDRTTMAHSIESRLPFLDYRLVEYMFSLPDDLKIRNGLGKYIQRRALTGLIPETVRARTEKVGFNAPSEKWFRGRLRDQTYGIIQESRLFENGLLDRDGFQRLWQEHQVGTANHYQFIWQALNLELWLREYFR